MNGAPCRASRCGRLALGLSVHLTTGLAVGCGSNAAPARAALASAVHDGTTKAPDGVPLHYVASDVPTGVAPDAPALLFVHGWTGDTHFWDRQLAFFSRTHRVIALDLAGHGSSGTGRTAYDAVSYADDVRAVANAAGARRLILVGHSMSGNVVLEAAVRMPNRVVGVIGVDCFQDLDEHFPPVVTAQIFAGSNDYPTWVHTMLDDIFGPANPAEKERVIGNALRLDPARSVATLRWNFDYPRAPVVERLRVPIGGINGDLEPTKLEQNQRRVPSFRVIVLEATGHYPMLERPDAFNDALARLLVELGLARPPA